MKKNLILLDVLSEIISILGIDYTDKDKIKLGCLFVKENI